MLSGFKQVTYFDQFQSWFSVMVPYQASYGLPDVCGIDGCNAGRWVIQYVVHDAVELNAVSM